MSSSRESQSSTLFPLLSATAPYCEEDRIYPRAVTFSDGKTLPLFSGGIVTAIELEQIIADCAAGVIQRYPNQKILLIQVLEGARPFCRRLFKYIEAEGRITCELAEVKISSYTDGTKAGEHKVVLPLQSVTGQPLHDLSPYDTVLVLDDLIDAGGTFLWLVERYLPEFKPRDVRACFMLDKKRSRQIAVQEALARCEPLVGKVVPDEWVVGFGLDITLLGGVGGEDLHLFRNELPGGIYAFNAAIEKKLIAEYQANPDEMTRQLEIYGNAV